MLTPNSRACCATMMLEKLRRDDKETEQQENGRPVDVGNNVAGGDAGKDHHCNRPQQNDAHTIELQSRHARHWATNMLEAEPKVCEELFAEAGEPAVDRTRMFYHQHLGSHPAEIDSLDATAALMRWANERRGFQYSR